MTYLNAPQTRLLATNCAACDRPLCDAESVEAGLGPVCRGYINDVDGEPDWKMAKAFVKGFVDEKTFAKFGDDRRRAANVMVHRIAIIGPGPCWESKALVCAIWSLGYQTLAIQLTKRVMRKKVGGTSCRTITEEQRKMVARRFGAKALKEMDK